MGTRLPTVSSVTGAKYYLIQYNDKNFRILKNKYQIESGWELTKRSKTLEDLKNYVKSILIDSKEDREEIERISLSRTKRNIRELALCNNFDYFGTITINRLLV